MDPYDHLVATKAPQCQKLYYNITVSCNHMIIICQLPPCKVHGEASREAWKLLLLLFLLRNLVVQYKVQRSFKCCSTPACPHILALLVAHSSHILALLVAHSSHQSIHGPTGPT